MSIRKNQGVFWNTMGSAMWGLNSFVMLAAVSNLTTVATAGSFGIAFTTAQMLYIVGLFGSSHFQMTDYQELYSFRDYAVLRLFSCLLMLLGCAGSILFLNFTGDKALYTVLLCILMLLNDVGDLFQCLFFQKNRLDFSGSALFYRTFWSLLTFCGVLWLGRSIVAAILAQIAVNLVLTVSYACRAGKMFPEIRSRNGNCRVPGLLKECFPLFLGLLLMNFTVNAPKYGVELTLDDTAQGYFNMVFMPAQVINLCSQFVFKPYLNQYSQLLSGGNVRQFRSLLLKQGALIFALTLVCCGGAWLLGIPVLSFFYGQDLNGCLPVLLLVILGGGALAACQLMYYVLVIMRNQRWILVIYLIAGALSPVAAWFLAGGYGIAGAGFSFLLIHILILALYILQICSTLRRKTNA